jgi:dephospho-CoA kinase
MSAAPPRSSSSRSWRVGLTGGIASGKSTVSGMFADLGVPIIDADAIAREVLAPRTVLLQRVVERFGRDVQRPDGSLDRAALRQRVFANEHERRELEALVQPAIRERSEELAKQATGAYVLFVIPLLVETKASTRFDRVLVIDCPEALQLKRLLSRDDGDLRQAQAMIAAQASRTERLAIADDIIVNDGEPQALQSAVVALHAKYALLAAAARQPQA